MPRTTHIARALLLAGGLGTAGLLPASAVAQGPQTHASILEAARGFLEAQVAGGRDRTEIRMGSLDRRLRLARCDAPLEGFLPPGGRLQGNTSVGVRCTGSRPWKLYVPARIARFREVAVASGYIGRGTRITGDQVTLAERNVTDWNRGFITEAGQAVGKTAKRDVREGQIIDPRALTRPTLIRRGEQVTIITKTSAIEVRMKGKALSNGARGELIRVENTKSQRIIEGEVTARGFVTVRL